jgi:hypothetical protein
MYFRSWEFSAEKIETLCSYIHNHNCRIICNRPAAGIGSVVERSLKIVNWLKFGFQTVHFILSLVVQRTMEREIFCCAIAINHFHFFLGGGDKCILWLSFAKKEICVHQSAFGKLQKSKIDYLLVRNKYKGKRVSLGATWAVAFKALIFK